MITDICKELREHKCSDKLLEVAANELERLHYERNLLIGMIQEWCGEFREVADEYRLEHPYVPSIQETAEILADQPFAEDLEESIEQMKRGDTVAWEAVKSELDSEH